MTKRNFSILLFLILPLLLPLAAQANTVVSGQYDITWTFSSKPRLMGHALQYDIYFENTDFDGWITEGRELDVEVHGEINPNTGLPTVIWSREIRDGQFRLFQSHYDGSHWSAPSEMLFYLEVINDRENYFKFGPNGQLYMTFIRDLDGCRQVMFGRYKFNQQTWNEWGPVDENQDVCEAYDPFLYTIQSGIVMDRVILGFIAVYSDQNHVDQPPDRSGSYHTIEVLERYFSSGDTSPWYYIIH